MPEVTDVTVVGGGLMGVAIAAELSYLSFRVTLVEMETVGSGASCGGFGAIGAAWLPPGSALQRVAVYGVAAYRELCEALGGPVPGVNCGGSLMWSEEQDAPGMAHLRETEAALDGLGMPTCNISDAEVRALEPNLRPGKNGPVAGLYSPADLWCPDSVFAQFLARRARDRGADIREHTAVTGFTLDTAGNISTVKTTNGNIATGALVLAAGGATSQLCMLLQSQAQNPSVTTPLPVRIRRCAAGYVPSADGRPPISRMLFTPGPHRAAIRPAREGVLVWGDGVGADHITEVPAAALARATGTLKFEPGFEGPSLTIFGQIETPDGLPIAGALPGIPGAYVLVSPESTTLCLLLARLLAAEISAAKPSELLAHYTPARFLRRDSSADG